jgi:nitronate monooxygenase
VVDAIAPVPVATAGGVADGRGLAAALMLGAAGVLVGTRFYAAEEALGADAAKARIVEASGDETVRGKVFDIVRQTDWPEHLTGRVLKNDFAKRWFGNEANLKENLAAEVSRYDKAKAQGDFDVAAVIAGECVDLIHDLPPAGEIVVAMVRDAEALLKSGWKR